MVNYKKFIWPIVIILLIILLIVIRASSKKIQTINIDNIDKNIKNNGYSLIYVGEVNDELLDRLKQYKKDYGFTVYLLSNSVEEVNEKLQFDIQGTYAYLVYDENGYIGKIDNTIAEEYYDQYFNKYIYNELPAVEAVYKKASADQYIRMVNSNDYTIAVLGDSSCTYCNMLEHVINDISKNGKYDIYYLRKSDFTETDYNKIIDLDFTIPEKCTIKKEPTSLKAGFSTPMTLVTKNGKLVDCILGYYEYDIYLAKLDKIMEG